MLPNSNSGWTAHTKGVANWVESLGPEPFSNGVLRTLFVGFRPLLVGFRPSLILASLIICVVLYLVD